MSLATKAALGLLPEPTLPRPAVVQTIKAEAYGIATFGLAFQDAADAAGFSFHPGQFNMLYLPGFGESAISIASDPAEPRALEHTIRYAGMVTRGFSRLKVGSTIGLRGPYGSRWPLELASGKDLLIVAGGIGLAPLRPVILSILRHREAYGRVQMLYGGRTPQDLLYTDEIDRWQQGGIEIQISVDRAEQSWHGFVGVIPMAFYRIKVDPKKTLVFTCGPEIMMQFVLYESLARRIPKKNIYLSLERNMKCAVAFCGHCQYGPNFICREGPILNYAAIEPFFMKEEF